jgi:hypothetical protein
VVLRYLFAIYRDVNFILTPFHCFLPCLGCVFAEIILSYPI